MNYKHKVTGHIASPTHSGKNYIVTHPQSYTIPKWIVESGNDWEKVIDFPIGTVAETYVSGHNVYKKEEDGWYLKVDNFKDEDFVNAKITLPKF